MADPTTSEWVDKLAKMNIGGHSRVHIGNVIGASQDIMGDSSEAQKISSMPLFLDSADH